MIVTLSKETIDIVREVDLILFRTRVKKLSDKIKMGLLNQTKLITAGSELVRNIFRYAKKGKVIIEEISKAGKIGIRLTFIDEGPGIADVEQAMSDGFSTGSSLGLGLPGAKRLVNEFEIKSEAGKGTTIKIVKWKNG
jgi:serine/threonine-protein kinase RsbT